MAHSGFAFPAGQAGYPHQQAPLMQSWSQVSDVPFLRDRSRSRDAGPRTAAGARVLSEAVVPGPTGSQSTDDPQQAAREWMISMYKVFNPAKIEDVPRLLEKYAGREASLCLHIREKYMKLPPLQAAPQEVAVPV